MGELHDVLTSLSGLLGLICAILVARRGGLFGWAEHTLYGAALICGSIGFAVLIASLWQ